MLVALKLRFGETLEVDDKRVLVAPSVTDKRGNGAALNKLMSTRFPSSAVLMELVKGRGMRTIVEWAPREFNKEVDKLANGDFESFDPAKRIPVLAQTLTWKILPEALEAGREADRAYLETKASE